MTVEFWDWDALPAYEKLHADPVRWFVSHLIGYAAVAVASALIFIAGVAIYAWLA